MTTYQTKPGVYGRHGKGWPAAGLILLGGLAFAGILLGLFWLGMRVNRPDGFADRAEAGPTPASSRLETDHRDDGRTPLQAALGKHLAASGLAKTQSLAIGGTYETSGARLDLDMQAKRPSLYRQVLTSGETRILHAFDGERAWQENPLVEDGGRSEVLDELNRRILILECSYAALSWHYDSSGTEGLELVADGETVRHRTCHVIRNATLLETPTLHYIDAGTGLELRRTAEFAIDGSVYTVVIDYQSPAFAGDDGGDPGEDGYLLRVNDRLVAEATFRSKRTNPGLMSWMFDQRPGL
jgi:hypothetical protein